MELFLESNMFSWFILPLLIFLARIIDVTFGTIRIIFVSRGQKLYAPLLGFFEALVFILVISQVMQHLSNILCYLAYGAGFAFGNYVGIKVEEKLAMGFLVVRIIILKDQCEITQRLIDEGFGITIVDAHGASKEVKILYSVIRRKDLARITGIIEMCDSRIFYSVEEIRGAHKGVFPSRPPKVKKDYPILWRRMLRKRK